MVLSFAGLTPHPRPLSQLVSHASSLWGSGWTFLVLDSELKLRVVNSFTTWHPLGAGVTPLLAIDMWEHARWSDYGADVEAYVRGYLKSVDWAAVSEALLTAANSASEREKLRYLVRLSSRAMRRLMRQGVFGGAGAEPPLDLQLPQGAAWTFRAATA